MFRPIINLSAVGMPVEALISLELDQRRMADVVQGLRALPEVLEVKVQAGREDLLVHVAIASLEALQVLTASIVDIDGVRKTTSTFSVGTPSHSVCSHSLTVSPRTPGGVDPRLGWSTSNSDARTPLEPGGCQRSWSLLDLFPPVSVRRPSARLAELLGSRRAGGVDDG